MREFATYEVLVLLDFNSFVPLFLFSFFDCAPLSPFLVWRGLQTFYPPFFLFWISS